MCLLSHLLQALVPPIPCPCLACHVRLIDRTFLIKLIDPCHSGHVYILSKVQLFSPEQIARIKKYCLQASPNFHTNHFYCAWLFVYQNDLKVVIPKGLKEDSNSYVGNFKYHVYNALQQVYPGTIFIASFPTLQLLPQRMLGEKIPP